MSPEACRILIKEIMPTLSATIPRLRLVGCDDVEEMTQDAVAVAAAMLDSAERAGKQLIGKSIVHYSLQRIKNGRRSTSSSRTCVLSPATILDGNVVVASMDEPMGSGDEDGALTLGEMLVCDGDDAAMIAGRNIDWNGYMDSLDSCDRDIVRSIAEDRSATEVAHRWDVSPSAITQRKHKIGQALMQNSGGKVLSDACFKPQWAGNIMACRERAAAKWAAKQKSRRDCAEQLA